MHVPAEPKPEPEPAPEGGRSSRSPSLERSEPDVVPPVPEPEQPAPPEEPSSPSPEGGPGARLGRRGRDRARARRRRDFSFPTASSSTRGIADGERRTVGIVVSRYNGEITNRLLDGAMEALGEAGVSRDRIDIMAVPVAFELPLGRDGAGEDSSLSCIVALGCVIRGDTPHFDYVCSEAASGLQLAGLETGVPVAFGVLTCDTRGAGRRPCRR